METSQDFLTVARNIISRFDYDYSTISSLQLILTQLGDLSKEDKETFASTIISIVQIINSFGHDDKRVTDKQANEVIHVFQKSLLLRPAKKDSFISLIQEILMFEFETNHITVGHLYNILNRIDCLSLKTQTYYANHIMLIRTTINLFKFNEDKVLTDHQIETVKGALRNHPANTEMKYDTFLLLIKDIIKEFDTYKTVEDLQRIIDMINYLSPTDTMGHADHIDSIGNTITSMGEWKSLPLTDNDKKKMMLALRRDSEFIYKPEQRVQWDNLGMFNVNGSRDTSNIFEYKEEYSDLGSLPKYHVSRDASNMVVYTKKLSRDDDIYQIVEGLATNLTRNTLESDITNFIYDYFEFISIFSEGEEYKSVINEIKGCLMKHGWKCKSETTMGGFYSSPNKHKMTGDIQEIVDKYF
jgi:hypothetical protein